MGVNSNSFFVSSFPFLGHRQLFSLVTSCSVAVALTSCSSVTIDQYQATAETTFTWRVRYTIDEATYRNPRFEEFASNSLLNYNGEKPEDAVIGPDDEGLWWPKMPPKPSIDQVEQREKVQEIHHKPELLRTVKYHLTYQQDGQTVTLPTNYQVYRQVARAYPYGKKLQLTLGINDGSVEKAEPLD
ncbi:MAG: hypothetical protein F6J96_05070 [Symploca sp. SIO1C2]|nr:hypothetical protein [Symploca sp. SIO1C2]